MRIFTSSDFIGNFVFCESRVLLFELSLFCLECLLTLFLGAGHYLSAGWGEVGLESFSGGGGGHENNCTSNGGGVKISFMNPWGGAQI